MITATIFEAKTNLSELVKQAQEGEEVVITSGRERTPVARLIPMQPLEQRRLGAWLTPGFEIPDSFWEPMSDEECGYAGDELTI
jgi:prevent-host-death family protein